LWDPEADRVEFEVLGPVEVRRDGVLVELGGPKQRAVLCRLLLAQGAVVPAERIIDDLWSGDPPPKALGVLQAHISTLRRALEPERAARSPATVLVSRPPGYALIGRSDAQQFEELLQTGMAALADGGAATAVLVLDQALGLWSGSTPFADFADEPWLSAEVARLAELHLVAREHRWAAALDVGDAHSAIPALEALVKEHPLREGVWRLLVLALYRTGRQADALAALRSARATLSDELGLDPSPALQALEAEVLAQSPNLDASIVPAVQAAETGDRRVSQTADDPATPNAGAGGHAFGSSRVLVGRDALLAQIDVVAAHAADGLLRTVVISGEPGIGKTWLSDAVAGGLSDNGWRVVQGQCHQSSGAPALWPWIQVLQALASGHPLPDDLAQITTDAPVRSSADAADARFHQHHAIGRYLADTAIDQPLLVVLDDLQWADAASLRLLGDLPDLAKQSRILVLAATRTGEGGEALGDALTRLSRHEGLRLTISGLSQTDVALVVAASGLDVDAAELTRRTGGNPFLLRETIRSIAMNGVGTMLDRVPDTAADLLRERLARLPPEAQTVLQVAAVVGSAIDLELVIAVTAQSEDEVLDALDAAAVTGILSISASGGLEFAHDLVRETLYGDMAPSRRTRLHARIVDELEKRPRPDVSALATHAAAAGPGTAKSALRWAVAAAEQAKGRLAFQDAVRWWKQALRAQEQVGTAEFPDSSQRVELILQLVQAQLDAGYMVEAEASRTSAIVAADDTGDQLLVARALVAFDLPGLFVPRRYDDIDLNLVGRLERALSFPELPEVLRCRLLGTLSNELYYQRDDRRSALSEEALNLARQLDDPQLLGFALTVRYWALDVATLLLNDEMRVLADELIELDREHRRPELGVIGHQMRMVYDIAHFDLQSADLQAGEAERLIRRLQVHLKDLQHQAWVFNRILLEGRFEQAEAALSALEAEQVDWWEARPLIGLMRLFFLWRAGRLLEAEPLLPMIREIHPAIAHDALLLVMHAKGEADKAKRLAANATWPRIQYDWIQPSASCLRASAALAVGTDQQMKAAYDALVGFAGINVVTSTVDGGPADFYLGQLARRLDDTESAAHHFRVLAELTEAAGLAHWQQIAIRELGATVSR
jgi:DNA-binding SARP family transcriptional activator